MTDATPVGPSDLLRRTAAATPDRTALVDPHGRLSAGELDEQVTAAALALLAAGLRQGERVALQLPTGRDFVTLYLGALRAGLVAVPVNPAYTEPEVRRLLADASAALHLDERSAAALLAGARPGADPHLDANGEQLAVLLYT
ncbi:MAG TPA: AMP-binding protein, partial [Jatrophihabitans sp.]|nr:AMP-binding protein [Jatrophihabitans sp.]